MSNWLRAYLNGRVRWEYLVDSPTELAGRSIARWLDGHGSNGWELIAVKDNGVYIFKRGRG